MSDYYTGLRGAAYVAARQEDPRHFGYRIDAGYFTPFLSKDDFVLDFGCGNGGMLPYLAQVAAGVEGLEINEHARSIAESYGFSIHPSLASLPTDRHYDAVVSNHIFEHVPNAMNILKEMHKHIKSGGLLVTKLPFDDIRDKHQQTWSLDDIDHHLKTWTPRLFANVLYDAGYTIEDIRVVTSAWHPRLFPLYRVGLHRFAFSRF